MLLPPCWAGRGGFKLGLDRLCCAAASPGAAGGERLLDGSPPPALLLAGFGLLPSAAVDCGSGGESGILYILLTDCRSRAPNRRGIAVPQSVFLASPEYPPPFPSPSITRARINRVFVRAPGSPNTLRTEGVESRESGLFPLFLSSPFDLCSKTCSSFSRHTQPDITDEVPTLLAASFQTKARVSAESYLPSGDAINNLHTVSPSSYPPFLPRIPVRTRLFAPPSSAASHGSHPTSVQSKTHCSPATGEENSSRLWTNPSYRLALLSPFLDAQKSRCLGQG